MCGIVGYVGSREAVSFLIPALRRLEYRGYDSAGLATLNGSGIEVRRARGRIAVLEAALRPGPPRGHLGIAHTRWATHGRPSETNAHPQVDCRGNVAIVHNGIIENHRELRRALAAEGHNFRSSTDSEVIAHLIERHMRHRDLPEAVRLAADSMQGAFAIACIAEEAPGILVAVRSGSSPLVIGCGSGEVFLASDVPALPKEARDALILEDGEMAVLTAAGIAVRDRTGASVARPFRRIPWNAEQAEKNGFPHFMLKEIIEQPEAVRATLTERLDPADGQVEIPELMLKDRELAALGRLCFVACGTSYHAALIGKYLVEGLARLPVDVDLASEFRYRQPVMDGRVLTVAISQSGETADTLAALRTAKELGSRSVAVCNVVGSSLARETDGVLYTRAGLEIGVASTKAFTTQVAAMTLLALKLGLARKMLDRGAAREIVRGLLEIPGLLADPLGRSDRIRALAERFAEAGSFLYLGRGVHYPMALEGALKLKEISYVHAEGYAAGEMKHGPIALIDPRTPVVAICPEGPTRAKMLSNIEEVKARDGIVMAVATEGDEAVGAIVDEVIPTPRALPWLQPMLVGVPLQLFAYHMGVLRGCDVDQPRNLAKSVTVE